MPGEHPLDVLPVEQSNCQAITIEENFSSGFVQPGPEPLLDRGDEPSLLAMNNGRGQHASKSFFFNQLTGTSTQLVVGGHRLEELDECAVEERNTHLYR